MGTEFIRQNRMALLLPSRKNLLFQRVGLLPDRNENQPNVGRGFTPRRKICLRCSKRHTAKYFLRQKLWDIFPQ